MSTCVSAKYILKALAEKKIGERSERKEKALRDRKKSRRRRNYCVKIYRLECMQQESECVVDEMLMKKKSFMLQNIV